ncbi:predicted protein [Lichtheimia corymbifera JMRC:FSU:9682]|uniref:Uncharacterized protein n=1 Tax=Lichtheimia corymbifera JMRC:FSU:9682 TaxID=1263082 RepID=A0A068SDB0_9FUNG|nr:predicted protein [Lichtheimia corymbifera JMRC:FSU:9682]
MLDDHVLAQAVIIFEVGQQEKDRQDMDCLASWPGYGADRASLDPALWYAEDKTLKDPEVNEACMLIPFALHMGLDVLG